MLKLIASQCYGELRPVGGRSYDDKYCTKFTVTRARHNYHDEPRNLETVFYDPRLFAAGTTSAEHRRFAGSCYPYRSEISAAGHRHDPIRHSGILPLEEKLPDP